ncbi:glycoside hydrolase family 2 protein [Lutibacter citreus]|uniref:glycoside hydrolase family 2 protein n=1 Tax=Lutibacter citreus TaxID=2138210 RepID=UPI000DBE4360|nr:glycoside hydrolase family 2 TIM barrel-domain containing protein [Lutibacter citreus]
MKHLFYLIFLVSLSISCNNEKIQPDNNEQISLNGTWQFLASNSVSEKEILNSNYKSWNTLEVPGNWDTQNDYTHYVGKGYYQKNISVPENWKGRQVRVKFDAVYETSKVWLNGKLLGTHKGGYTPFEFNITNQVNYGSENSIVVMADNTFKRGAWWAWGGISRNVSLFTNEDVRLVWQHISAIPNFEKGIVDFKIEYKIENNGDTESELALVSTIENNNGENWLTKKHSIKIAGKNITKTEITFSEELKNVDLWHFDRPNLYNLKTEILDNNQLKDIVLDKFGIRKLEVKGEQLVLNNEPIRVNGFNRVHDHRLFGNSEPDELIQQDILDIKSLGGNFSRIMHSPASKSLLKFCDSIGYLLIEEIPVWGRGAPNATANNPITKQWLSEMIERDYNHASVVGWSVGNEIGNLDCEWEDMTMTPDQFKYVNSMFDHVISLDKTRLKTYASFTAYLPKSDMLNEPVEKADFISINTYGGHLKKVVETHKKFPGKPIFFSEIGKGQIGSESNDVLDEKLLDEMKLFNELPYVIGTALWTYNDYRSNYKNTPASENRAWGVVDVWRNKKAAFNQIRNVYAPIAKMQCELTDSKATVIITPRNKVDIPSFVLKDYKLKCDFINEKGAITNSEEIKLPIINPGDKNLAFEFKNDNGAVGVKASLISSMNIELKAAEFPIKKTIKLVDESAKAKIVFLKKYRENVTVGYRVNDTDSLFTFKYGANSKELTKEISTGLKGSFNIPWKSEKPFFIQVKSDKLDWSEIKGLK